MERGSSSRAKSTRPPSVVPVPRTAMVSAASRPITQQGLGGLRPIQTPSAGVNRIYRDKRYYMSLIQSHMNSIKEEVARLNKSTSEYKVIALNKHEYRRQAEEHAKKFAEMQESLNVYNTVLDIHLSRAKVDHIHSETAEIRKKNEAAMKELENIFNYKVKYEEQLTTLKKEVEEEDLKAQAVIEKLSEEDKQKYMLLEKENQNCINKITNMQTKIQKCKDMVEAHMETISKSKNKQEKLQLLKNYNRLQKQKDELEDNLKNTLSPTEQREQLLQQVKQDKADIEALSKVKKSLEEDHENQKVRLAELEKELEGKDSVRLKKHRELRERGEHMNVFIASFDEKFNEVLSKINETQEKITLSLEYLTESVTDLNFDELDNIQLDSAQQSTVEGLNKKCDLLLTQIERLKSFKERCENEMTTLKEKEDTMIREIESYKNVDGKREEFVERKAILEKEVESSRSVLDTTNSAVAEVQRRKTELKKKLNETDAYHEVNKLEKEIEELRAKNDEIEEVVNSTLSMQQIENLMQSLKELVEKRNEQLKNILKKK